MSTTREWMYRRFENGIWTSEFLAGLETFIEFATSQKSFMDKEKIKCPCTLCDNEPYRGTDEVRYHISRYGFVKDYHIWRFHGETSTNSTEDINRASNHPAPAPNTYHTMVIDHAGPSFQNENIEETPHLEAQRIFDMLNAADRELWPGCKNHSQLSLVVRMMSLKAENHMLERCYDQLTQLKQTILFKCEWFDSSSSGTLVHPDFKLVSINHRRRYQKYEPFVLASQAEQVYFCSYPSTNQARKDWWEVCKVKPRFKVEVPSKSSESTIDPPFQEDAMLMEMMGSHTMMDDDLTPIHPQGGMIEMDEIEEEIDEVVISSDEEDQNLDEMYDDD